MNSRRSIQVKRVAAAALFGLVLVQVIPSIADVINGENQTGIESAPTPTPLVTVSPESTTEPDGATPTPSTSAAPQPTASIAYPDIETATPAPTYAPSQEIRIRIPSKFPVDPRATSVHISPIAITGGETLLICMSVDNAVLQISGSNPDLLIEGNGTKSVRVSGDGAAVNALLNAGRGLRLVATNKINGATVTTRAASLTAPSIEADLCSGAVKVLRSSISAMGLGLNTVKVPVPIN
jgi:hypothetical protein